MSNGRDGGNLAASEDRELRALFAARRPDAARFRDGVAARLARSQDRGSGGADVPAEQSRTWRGRAASWLPALPPGTSLGPTWSTWLSLPALLLLGCLAAFWRGDRSLVATLLGARSTTPRRQTSRQSGTWWQRNAMWLRAGLAGAVLGGLGYVVGPSAIRDVILVALMASMAVLVAKVGTLAAREGAPTEAIGRCVTDLLVAAIVGLMGWCLAGGIDTIEAANAFFVLVLGTLAVLMLRGWRARRLGLGLANGIALVALGVPLAIGWWPEAAVPALRRELAQATPSGADQPHWRALELCGDALRAAGEPLPDLTNLRQHLADLITASPGSWPETWTAGARLGLITAEQWQRLAGTEYVTGYLPRLLAEDGHLVPFGQNRFLLPALMATHELTASDREHLVARIERSWPDPAAPNPGFDLGDALLCVQWLDLLERGDLVAARVPALRDLLRHYWVPKAARRGPPTGGFAYRIGDDCAGLPWTIDGLELLVRIGPPPEVSVAELRGFLQRSGGFYPMEFLAGWSKQAYAGRLLLDVSFGAPARGQGLLDQRLLIGCLLLVILAIRAVWFTRPLGRPGHGAMP